MLSKQNRITKQKDFDRFFGRNFKQQKGRNISAEFLFIKILPAETAVFRIGFMVNNKVDKRATMRNKIKRQLREVVRACLPKINNKVDLLIVVNKKIVGKEYGEIEKTVLDLLKRGRAIDH
ncbi:ribonuclease P protein component [Candidatus Falkowbacteria bacterium]|jgi:ribonuclease P protein component|nr:ribonuclease P protein component [Candidatus Falkowbacteria bacterium]MBT7007604.1 ribonuclease P protein component [Candidatus Falkowbacteria bacterium]